MSAAKPITHLFSLFNRLLARTGTYHAVAPLPPLAMPEGRTQDRHVPQTADHAFEVSSDSAGKFPVHSLPHGDLISVMILRRADYYNDQMRGLALQYLHLMPRSDQTRIKFQLQELVWRARMPCNTDVH